VAVLVGMLLFTCEASSVAFIGGTRWESPMSASGNMGLGRRSCRGITAPGGMKRG